MNVSDYPRVLMVMMTKVKAEDPTNLLIRNEFGDWPKDRLAQIHATGDPVGHGEFCGHYYRLQACDRLFGRVFQRLRSGVVGMVAADAVEKNANPQPRGLPRRWFRVVKKCVGDWLIASGLWEMIFCVRVSKPMEQFVEDFKPDLVYCQGYSLGFASLPLLIAEKFRLPICFQTTDDWPRRAYRWSPVCWLLRRRADMLIRSAKARLAFGEKMREVYERRYRVPFEITYHLDDPTRFVQGTASPEKICRIVYTGSLSHRRHEALQDVLKAIRKISDPSRRFEILVYSSGIPRDMPAGLLEAAELRFAPLPEHGQLPSVLARATILLLPESFNEPPQAIEYSISTKAHLYMMSRRPVLVYGPPYSGTVDYAAREEWGLVVSERSVSRLVEAISEILKGNGRLSKLRANAAECIRRHHGLAAGRERFRIALAQAAGFLVPSGAGLRNAVRSPEREATLVTLPASERHKDQTLVWQRSCGHHVGIVYHIIPHYRVPVFAELTAQQGRRGPEYVFFAAKRNTLTSVATAKYEEISRPTHPSFCRWEGEIRNHRLISNLIWQTGAVELAKTPRFDTLIYLGDCWFLSTWVSAFLARRRRKRVLFWTHGFYGNESSARKNLRKMFYRLADGLLLYGERSRELCMQLGFPRQACYVVYNSLDVEEQTRLRNAFSEEQLCSLRKHLFVQPEKPVLLYLGRLLSRKRPDMVLRTMRELANKRIETNALFVGEGPERAGLEALARELRLEGSVKFYGECYGERELAPLIAMCDICVAPGEIGLACMHSMVYGVPVVTHGNPYRQGPEFEAIVPGVNGALFQENDFPDLVKKVACFLGGTVSRQALKQACYQTIEERYSPAIQASIINQAVKGLPAGVQQQAVEERTVIA